MRIGLFITDKSIKIAKATSGRPFFLKIPLEEGILQDGFIKEKEKFKTMLLKLSRQFNFAKGEIVLGIAEKHIFGKAITISDHGENLEEKINEELENSIPSVAQSYTDWQILEKNEDNERIFIVSVAAGFIDSYLEVFRATSTPVVGIEPIAFALSRHIPKPPSINKGVGLANEPAPLGSTLLVALEETEILLTIMNKDRSIELTSVFTQQILEHRDEFLSEVGNMRSFYDKRSGDEKITRVCVTGEGASEEIKNPIASSLAIPVELLRIENKTVSPQDALSFFSVFALLDLPIVFPKTHEHINLLPQEVLNSLEKAKKESQIHNLFRNGIIVLGILCFFYIAILGFLFFDIQATSSQINKEREIIKTSNASKTLEKVSSINKSLKLVKKIMGKDQILLDVLSFLADKTSGGVVITHYMLEDTSAIITGKSLEREVLIGFGQILETEGKFKNVHIPLASLEKKGANQFSLSFEVAK